MWPSPISANFARRCGCWIFKVSIRSPICWNAPVFQNPPHTDKTMKSWSVTAVIMSEASAPCKESVQQKHCFGESSGRTPPLHRRPGSATAANTNLSGLEPLWRWRSRRVWRWGETVPRRVLQSPSQTWPFQPAVRMHNGDVCCSCFSFSLLTQTWRRSAEDGYGWKRRPSAPPVSGRSGVRRERF